MSRSIHTTRRSIAEAAKRIQENNSTLAEVIAEWRKNNRQLGRKRLIKQQVRAERKRQAAPLAGTAIATVAIEVLDKSPMVHHAASPEDIRAILSALPAAATEGIARIQLTLGQEYMDEISDEEEPTRDPFTGRISEEVFPGVFSGTTLGAYSVGRSFIKLFAYVYSPERLPLPRSLCEVYLRLHALKTLVHEVAHYHDEIKRVGRGRWLADRKANVEWYAEKMEHQWTNDVVLPYLESAYPGEVKELRKWVEHRGGLLLPLEFFAGDSRSTKRNGPDRWVSSTSGAFESWVEELPNCATRVESCLLFAESLHYSEAFEECLAVLETILAGNLDHVESLAWKAETLCHLDRLDESLAAADHALRLDAQNERARETRGIVFEHRADWGGLLDSCIAWENTKSISRAAQREVHLHRAIAYCGLGNKLQMEASLAAFLAALESRDKKTAARRALNARRMVFRRAGKALD